MVLCRKLARSRRGISSAGIVFLLLLVCAGGGGYVYWSYYGEEEGVQESQLILRTVERGPFDHIVLEQGEIESSSNTEIICQVKSRGGGSGTAILWVIDEGTRVETGEKLVELDSSQLETELKQQKIIVSNSRAALTSAEALLQQAKIARQEYVEGVFRTEESAIESEIAVAQQELRKAQLNLRSTEKMVAKGLVSALQMEGDQFGVANTQNQLEAARGRLRVLQDLTRQKMLVQYDSDIEAAVAAREAARSTLLEEEEKLADIEAQIKACVVYAPAPGVVVHGNTYSSRGGNSEFVVEPGALVRERQTMIRLPDPDKMQVNAKINESRIALVREGMPAKVRVDAMGLELLGRVKKVNRYAEAGSWYNSSIKEYACAVEIINPPEVIRTGMTAEVRIFVEQLDDALQIPMEGIYEHSGLTFTLVRTPTGFETRQLEMGATNDTMATIETGLEEGERVVLNLRSHLNLMDLPEPEKANAESMTERLASHGMSTEIASGPTAAASQTVAATGPGGGPGQTGAPTNGGGAPTPAERINGMFDQHDSDSDGMLSADEVQAMPERARQGAEGADSNGDGKISKAEMTAAMAKLLARIRAESGGPGDDGGSGGESRGPGGGGIGG